MERVCISNSCLRTGIDIIFSEDMKDFLGEATGVLLTEYEWLSIASLPDRLPRFAGKFAGKEAVMKVLGKGLEFIEFSDIEIRYDDFGKPIVFLQGSALHYWQESGLTRLDISISHHKDYAVGIAVAL